MESFQNNIIKIHLHLWFAYNQNPDQPIRDWTLAAA